MIVNTIFRPYRYNSVAFLAFVLLGLAIGEHLSRHTQIKAANIIVSEWQSNDAYARLRP